MVEELKTLREFEKKTLEEEAKTKEAEEQRKARENEKHKRSIFGILLLVSLMFNLILMTERGQTRRRGSKTFLRTIRSWLKRWRIPRRA